MNRKTLIGGLLVAGLSLLQMAKAFGQDHAPPSRWIRGLASANAAEADQAALKVFQEGEDSLAALIALLDNDQRFAGQMLFYDRGAEVRDPPELSYVAMYLIHAIITQRLYESPVPTLKRLDKAKVREEDLLRAKAAYRAWWLHRPSGPLQHGIPLAETDLFWK